MRIESHNKHSLGLGIDHFDRDWFLPWNARDNFGRKDSCTIVNGSVTDQQSLCLFGDFSVKGGHDFIHCLNEGHL